MNETKLKKLISETQILDFQKWLRKKNWDICVFHKDWVGMEKENGKCSECNIYVYIPVDIDAFIKDYIDQFGKIEVNVDKRLSEIDIREFHIWMRSKSVDICEIHYHDEKAGTCKYCERKIYIPVKLDKVINSYIYECKHKIITLCGSTKFQDEFEKYGKELTFLGWNVLTVIVWGHIDKDKRIIKFKSEMDTIHKERIMMSEAVFIIDKNGYIGESTKSEIEFAELLGKKIYYASQNVLPKPV